MRNKIMKLAGLGWMVLAVSYVNALNIEQTKGPRIVLEEEEITLMEDGKEIQKILVSESSQEKDEILNMVREKVLRKLGVKSDQEIRAGELWDQYNGEVDKLLKVEKVKDRKLKFIDIDKDGKAFKEVILRTEFRIDEELDKSKKTVKIRRQISKNAKISENGKYAVIGTGIGTIDVINNDGTEISFRGEGPSESRLELLDNNGNVLWEKKFVEGRCPNFMDCIIAQNGIVAVIIGKGIEIGEDILHAYNTNGDEILVYPKKIGEAYPGGAGDMRISPNGRYLAVQVGFLYPTASKKVFFDLQSGSLWKADKPYVVYEITNEGQAKVDYYDADKKKLSATETIDFKKYLEE